MTAVERRQGTAEAAASPDANAADDRDSEGVTEAAEDLDTDA
jgi:hypothetical protein